MSTTDHIIKSYDDELARLMNEIRRMGDMAAQQLHDALRALEIRDANAAQRIIDADDAIDAIEHTIGENVVRLLALRAPMATDLRRVFAALRIASDLERIGDCAVGMARRIAPLPASTPTTPTRALQRLGAQAAGAVQAALDAWQREDTAMAWKAWHGDKQIDDAYTSLFREMLTYMMEDSRQITAGTHLLFMAKNIERIGDHATNIAESVWFAVTGDSLTAQTPAPSSGT